MSMNTNGLLTRVKDLIDQNNENWEILVALSQVSEYISGLGYSYDPVVNDYAASFVTFCSDFIEVIELLLVPLVDEHDEVPAVDEVAFQKIAVSLIGKAFYFFHARFVVAFSF